FSPTRATYEIKVPGDALLSAPMNGDIFGSGVVNSLDVVEGDPSRVRNLDVGVGSLRTIRAEASATGPKVSATLAVVDGRLTGTVTNESSLTLAGAAIVLGSAAQTLGDIAPGASTKINLGMGSNPLNQGNLSDRILGPMNWDGSSMSEEQQRTMVRRSMIDQISIDPMTGFASGFPADTAVLIAWGTDGVVPIEIVGQHVRHVANVLYQVPIAYSISGTTTFRYDLLRSSIVEATANFFSKDPWALNLGSGSLRVSYRPIPFEGTFTPTKVVIGMAFGGDLSMPAGAPIALREAARCEAGTAGCVLPVDGLPDFEVLDVRTGTWVQFEHVTQGRPYELTDAARWVEPLTGELQVRFVNQRADQISFQFPVELTGSVR
ncbi:MAG: polymer-forming cytoskeletal protein, partial [Chloroflexota bacterium]